MSGQAPHTADVGSADLPWPIPQRRGEGYHIVGGWLTREETIGLVRCLSDMLHADRIPAGAPGLTPRETEVLRHLAAGHSNKEVARRLTLSVRTVEVHRLNLRNKTQTGRLKDLVALARLLNLEPIP